MSDDKDALIARLVAALREAEASLAVASLVPECAVSPELMKRLADAGAAAREAGYV